MNKTKYSYVKEMCLDVFKMTDRTADLIATDFINENKRLRTSVAGVTFIDGNKKLLEYVKKNVNKKDVVIELKRDKNNKYDSNAIKVILGVNFSKNKYHIGFIPKEQASYLSKLMDNDIKVSSYFVEVSGGGEYNCGVNIEYSF